MTRGRGRRGRVRAHAAAPRLYLLRYARCSRRRQRAAGRRPHSGQPAPWFTVRCENNTRSTDKPTSMIYANSSKASTLVYTEVHMARAKCGSNAVDHTSAYMAA
ncbi:hypothetical protein K1T71_000172 [Dendrolimus kikuchii]|uniref:Uncharacterized protein n=1 Tax=Dendrolimus kikuchii TaxID=765133 RepID=A0ACC1DIF4_9NEOP|nr:hypothetical protein K1T71_000172 [Dendrolimus kikuchii]